MMITGVGWEVEGKGMENAPQAGYFQILYLHIDQIAQTYTHLLHIHTYKHTEPYIRTYIFSCMYTYR